MRAFYQKELKPFLTGTSPEAAWVLIGGTALLVAKREWAGLGGAQAWSFLAWLWWGVLIGMVGFLGRQRLRGRRQEGWRAATILSVALGMLLLTGTGAQGIGFWQTLSQPHYSKVSWLLASAAWLGPLPLLLILTVLPGSPSDFGWGMGRWRMWLPVWGILTVLMLGIIFLTAHGSDFRHYYPMYRVTYPGYFPQRDGWGFFLQYELAYGLYFLAWEFFFRSFMLFGLERVWGGPAAVLMQMVPFTLMHIGKPTLEFFSAIVAGLALGWLAWRGRSFWPCFILHWTCAGAMDLFAMLDFG